MYRATSVAASLLVVACSGGPGAQEFSGDASRDARSATRDGAARDSPAGDHTAGDSGSTDGASREAGKLDPIVFLISSSLATDPARREFRSLADFAAQGPACLTGGEELRFAGGQRFLGTLRLAACKDATGEVIVATAAGAPRATLSAAQTLAELGLSWEPVANPTFNGTAIAHLQGVPLFRAGRIARPVQQLYFGAERMMLARHPNPSAAGEPRYFRATAFYEGAPGGCGAATCVVGDDAQNPTWPLRTFGVAPGAFAVVRTSNWSLQRSAIVWHNPERNSLALADSLRTAVTGNEMPAPGFGFILFNTLPMIDEPGEWYYHPTEQALYFWPPDGQAPSAAATEINFASEDALRGAAISGNFGQAPLDLTVRDLVLRRPATRGLALVQARSLTVERVDVEQPEDGGISAWKLSGSARVEDCVVAEAAGNGISVLDVAGSTRVLNNRVLRPGRLHNQAALGMDFNGIRASRQGSLLVEGNRVEQPGYAGVMLGPSTIALTVRNNTLSGFCALLNDCGGIYFNGAGNTLTKDQLIERNTMVGGVGSTAGVPALWPPLAVGLYLDHGASHFNLRENRVEQCRAHSGSLYLHGGNHNLLRGNTVVASAGPAFGMVKLAPAYAPMADNRVELNYFSTATAADPVVRMVDQEAHTCADMRPAIKDNNVLTPATPSGTVFECR